MRTTAPRSAHAKALDEHVEHYLADNPGIRHNGALTIRDAIEHGWQGATADIAERLDAILEAAREASPSIVNRKALVDIVELTEELKREVGA